ncbi:hypothetical protein WMF37_47145 [Sorangium sp. So ce291]|uniref:hypothetical protein n=1 Tax=Sorangium sp. So ce291 TaxID=3133294 RepID=UPI003F61FF5F
MYATPTSAASSPALITFAFLAARAEPAFFAAVVARAEPFFFPAVVAFLMSRKQELRDIYASAWREDVPEEDREWAAAYRDICTRYVNRRRRDAIAQCAYEGYLQSSGGILDGAPGRPWPNLSHYASEPWCAFADRVEEAPEGETEAATAEAAAREYWDTLCGKAPPWDSDPDQAHWLAAVRAADPVRETRRVAALLTAA